MHLTRLTVLAVTLTCFASPLLAQDRKFPEISSLLPHRDVTADVVQMRSSEKVAAITKRLRKAVSSKADWWKAYVKANANIKPLPYHENFGISEDEYKLLLNSASLMRLVKVADAKITVKKAEGTIELSIVSANKLTHPLVFDLKKGSLKTPMATIAQATQRDSGKQGGLLGHHLAHTWTETKGDPDSGTYQMIRFTLGRISKTGNTFIQYSAAKMKDGKPEVKMELLMFIDRGKVGR